jgi:hypothetical protein
VITGRVVRKDSGKPIPEARVVYSWPGRTPEMYLRSVVTDAQGRFRLEPVPAGTLELHVFARSPGGHDIRTVVVEPWALLELGNVAVDTTTR